MSRFKSTPDGVVPLSTEEEAFFDSLAVPVIERKKAQINDIKQAKLTGTIIVSGMNISLDTDSKAIMALAKTNSRATRRIHTHAGDRAILTTAQFDGLVAAIENYGQAVMDRAYDLSEALDAAATAQEIDAIDVTAGWPQ